MDTDADLRELRRALPVPAERGFPAGRMHQREEHLMSSLLESSLRKEPRRLTRRGRRLTLTGTLAALTALALFVVAQLGGTPAYAVTTDHDGTVTIVVHYIDNPDSVNRTLRKAGIRAVVMLPTPAADCPVKDRSHDVPPAPPPDPSTLPGKPDKATGGSDSVTIEHFPDGSDRVVYGAEPPFRTFVTRNHEYAIQIRSAQVPAGRILVIEPQTLSHGVTGMGITQYPLPGPKCIVDP